MSEKLRVFACEHVKDQGPLSEPGHKSSDGKGLTERYRIGHLLEVGWIIGESIAYGVDTPKEVLYSMLIDDGVPRRGHRKNLLQGNFSKIGIC